MKLLLLSVTKDHFGLFDVTVRVNDKKDYTYVIRSQHEVDVFMEMIRHRPGKALNLLKEGDVSDPKHWEIIRNADKIK